MKTVLFLFVLIIYFSNECSSQYSLEWAVRADSGYVKDMTLDGETNVYLTGDFGSRYITYKYDNIGNREWSVLDTNNFIFFSDTPWGLVTDDSGNVYVTGEGWGIPFNKDFKTIKYNILGTKQWKITYDNPAGASDRGYNIVNFRDKYIYVSGTNSYGDSGSCNFKWTVVKYDLNGNFIWKSQYCGYSDYILGDYPPGNSMAVDSLGNVIINGMDKESASGNYFTVTIKYDSSGNQLWQRKIYNNSTGAIVTDVFSNIYIGIYNKIIKYTSGGDSASFKLTYPPIFIDTDTTGNLIVIGKISIGSSEKIITTKFDHFGNQLWSTESNTGFSPVSICVSKSGRTFIAANGVGNNYYKYHSFVYNTDGTLFWNAVYDDPLDTACLPVKIQADEYDNFYITGKSYGIGTGINILTLKYSMFTHSSQLQTDYSEKFILFDNYPNPFNPKTIIKYDLGIANYVSLKIIDIQGKEVKTLVNQKQNAGHYGVEFNGENLSSGIYFYKLEAGDFTETKSMVLLK